MHINFFAHQTFWVTSPEPCSCSSRLLFPNQGNASELAICKISQEMLIYCTLIARLHITLTTSGSNSELRPSPRNLMSFWSWKLLKSAPSEAFLLHASTWDTRSRFIEILQFSLFAHSLSLQSRNSKQPMPVSIVDDSPWSWFSLLFKTEMPSAAYPFLRCLGPALAHKYRHHMTAA